jgi:hypothetical protein
MKRINFILFNGTTMSYEDGSEAETWEDAAVEFAEIVWKGETFVNDSILIKGIATDEIRRYHIVRCTKARWIVGGIKGGIPTI